MSSVTGHSDEQIVNYTGGDSGSVGLMGLAQMLLGADASAIWSNYQNYSDGGIARVAQVCVSQALTGSQNRWPLLALYAFGFHSTGNLGTFKRTTEDGTAMMMGDIESSGDTADHGTLVKKRETLTWRYLSGSVTTEHHMDSNHDALHDHSIQGSRVFINDNPQQSLERYSSAPFPRVPTEWLGS